MSDSKNKDVKFSFNVVINKQKTQVLFAEIDSGFADVLFSFFALPLGKICRFSETEYLVGSLTTLHESLSDLNEAHFSGDGCKQMLLNPPSLCSDVCRNLKFNIGDTHSTKYFSCEDWNCAYPRTSNIGMYHGTVRCDCGKQLNREIPVRHASQAVDQVFTKTTANFILSDDLELLPNSTSSVAKILNKLGLVDLDGTKLRNVTFGIKEITDLLICSLFLENPLTEVILDDYLSYGGTVGPFDKRETPSYIFCPFDKRETPTDINDIMSIKVIIQKSTNNLLFVEAEEDFVDFLFSLLTISLDAVCRCLCLASIDNLFKSMTSPINNKYLRIHEITRLISPSIPHGYLTRHCRLPIHQEEAPNLQYHRTIYPDEEYLAPVGSSCNTFKSPICGENYVKGPSKYMVKDDLTVTPLHMASYISLFMENKIPISDIHEVVLEIGLQEASVILKASLACNYALSLGLYHLLGLNVRGKIK